MVWYSQVLKNFPQFVVIHTVKDFGLVNKAEVDVFLELSCFYDNTTMLAIEPDILECKVKWALGSITMNTASGGDRPPAELFQILKDAAAKVLHSICQQIWEMQQQPGDWKSQFSFQSQRKAMSNSVQTTAQLHSSHTLVK